jgi:uncharacterized protein YifE (UPF0438 family)
MSDTQTSFATSRKFYDDANFPYGFDRSGEFTVKQVQMLTERGCAYQELANGTRAPVTDEEHQFVEFSQGIRMAETDDERTWSRYISVLSKSQKYYGVGLNIDTGSSRESYSQDVD